MASEPGSPKTVVTGNGVDSGVADPGPEGGRVYLVGAGPGDPGLLTVRARALIDAVDVIAYDELIPAGLLSLLPGRAERIAVGRRHGTGSVAYRLHPAVLERARAGRSVMRLKAGDPLIFGRGGEEAEELVEAGIPFEIVPGVSAALGAAASAGIPLTHRLFASDVTFVTGHDVDSSHVSRSEWPSVASGRGTLVLFMAGKKLEANLARIIASGRSPDTPAAYVASATQPDERVIVGTLGDLSRRLEGADRSAPGLVFVGEVVQLHEKIGRASRPRAPAKAASAEVRAERPRGQLHVYTGQGKGKTTAALGLVFRALGRGLRVAVVQFIKGKWKTGERLFAEEIPRLTFLVMGLGFTWESDDLSRDRGAAQAAWASAKAMIAGGEHDLVVLDELTYAVNYGFVDAADIVAAVERRPAHVNVVITGRNAPEALTAIADVVTEMKLVKHPFERGIKAVPGIDY